MIAPQDLAAPVAAVSIASWVLVYSPQLYENWQLQSGDGLSVPFIVIWLLADALNGIGAFQQGLLSSMVVLAVYYCVCDVALLWQYYYYRHLKQVRARKGLQARAEASFANGLAHDSVADESTPLIAGATGEDDETPEDEEDVDLAAELTHDLAAAAAADEDVALALAEDEAQEAAEAQQWYIPMLKYTAMVLFVVLAGVSVWAVTPHAPPEPVPLHGPKQWVSVRSEWRWDAQVAGWISAVLYLASRIPQIIKNRETHCEGLSMALFLFTVLANGTYVASILLKSTELTWVMQNGPWIVGSVGTEFTDFLVLGQFVYYAPQRRHKRHLAKRRRILYKARARALQRSAPVNTTDSSA